MKYKELMAALLPYEDEDIDVCLDIFGEHITFWFGGGEGEIITIDVHE